MALQRNIGAGAEAELPQYAGQYRLGSCLGSGGMGVVHLAHSGSGLKLAVKVVHAEFARDPEFRARFRQEVAAARQVSGAFTAPVVDADPAADRPWMATLFIPGLSLAERVKRNGPMDSGQLRRLMAGLAEGLRDIHRVGVVHRDLKPSNVLLADDGPKVIDFGISRPKDSELRTETGKLIGTPPFMAPEQFRRPRDVGPAADIFALGSLMVHAATGRGPFDSDSPYVVAYQVVHDEPDLTGVPESLAPLVLRCLAKEPEDRPTPGELMRELRSVAASYDTQAFVPAQRTAPPRPPEDSGPAADSGPVADGERPRGRSFGRSRRLAVFGAGVLALAVGGVFAAVQLFGDGGAAERGAGVRAGVAAFSGWTVQAPGGTGAPQCSYASGRLLCARSGTVFALSAADGSLLWRHAAPKGPPGGPPVVAGGLVQPSPDGGGRLEALDAASGRPRWQRAASGPEGGRQAGGMLLLTGADGTVTGVDGASGRTVWSRRIAGYGAVSLAAFPGDPLAYATSTSRTGARTRIVAVDPATGAVRRDVRLDGYLRPVGAGGGSLFLVGGSAAYGDARTVVRYALATGEQRSVALPYPLERPRASVSGNVVHLLGAQGALLAVDTEARTQRWSLQTAASRGSAPVAGSGHVYVSTADGRLLAVDGRTGRLLGQTPARLGANGDEVAPAVPAPVVVGDRVYATAPDGSVLALDGSDPSTW